MLKADWSNSPLSEKSQMEILREVSLILKIKKDLLVSLAFVSPAIIKKLNGNYRGKDKVTDVLSFPFINVDNLVGEVLVCLEQAKKQAEEFQHSLEEEITILLVHGLIHLFGFDHLKKLEAEKMFALQKKVLKKLDIDWEIPEAG
ncbi:MAG: putative rRNA maturation factor [Candidatus Uhrbacteria bacterium GW2011_GWE2_45_35]|uniref:Endoribonuclease YbeY n=2 Tax=Candidatus Uhriibacteriota TaxID=1752732 RepID=A0A0G1JGU7_9BACT|nr:MAG: putative rRNA maturation factor [Candidatus Uhrbacteria bacterium GW2011_GWF2_44_350]KKU09135.1 MAG: putative rRNA maturation factor [Candidatus Uhrbacteria bacterium GW2011_GWE2_45_35]HBR80557.1 rRNA maturation RNase YbeY [Candidatus Uhrbacteria bacterium]HCU31456.1 rRNA maturation RNase YbeY [Candidatus Uhrbacteria bacterium]